MGVCLCALFLLAYPAGEMNRLFEYALVILCFAFACGRRRGDMDGFMALLALLFTVGADFFLVALKEEQWLPGMALFCCAQLCWALRLWGMEDGRRRLSHTLAWACACGTLLIVAVLLARGADPVLLMGAVYASFLVTTVFFSYLTPRNLLFTLGMTLFLGCDLFVAVNNAARGSATGSGSYAPGTVVTLMALPADGYSFICWNDGDTLNPRLVNAVVDRVYTAMFFSVGGTVTVCDTVHDTLMPTYYPIDIRTDNAQLGLGVGSAVLPAGVEVEVCGLPLEGGRFVMWDDGVVDNPRRVTVTGALTLRALFERTSLATAVAPGWTLAVDGRRLTVHCGAGERLRLYDGQGRCHLSQQAAGETTALLLPSAGVWLVQVGDGVARKIVIE